MADFLIVTPWNGIPSLSIARDEDGPKPHGWEKYQHDHPGAWCRAITDEEQMTGFGELWRRALEEDAQQVKPAPASDEAALPAPPPGAIMIRLPALAQIVQHSLIARGLVQVGDEFEAWLRPDGMLVVPTTGANKGNVT